MASTLPPLWEKKAEESQATTRPPAAKAAVPRARRPWEPLQAEVEEAPQSAPARPRDRRRSFRTTPPPLTAQTSVMRAEQEQRKASQASNAQTLHGMGDPWAMEQRRVTGAVAFAHTPAAEPSVVIDEDEDTTGAWGASASAEAWGYEDDSDAGTPAGIWHIDEDLDASSLLSRPSPWRWAGVALFIALFAAAMWVPALRQAVVRGVAALVSLMPHSEVRLQSFQEEVPAPPAPVVAKAPVETPSDEVSVRAVEETPPPAETKLSESQKRKAENFRRRAREWMQRGHYAKAKGLWQKSWEIEADRADTAAGIALSAMKSSQPEAALDWAQKAVHLAPNDADHHMLLGDVLHRQGDVTGARTAWKRALAIDPEQGLAKRRLAETAGRVRRSRASGRSGARAELSGSERDPISSFSASLP